MGARAGLLVGCFVVPDDSSSTTSEWRMGVLLPVVSLCFAYPACLLGIWNHTFPFIVDIFLGIKEKSGFDLRALAAPSSDRTWSFVLPLQRPSNSQALQRLSFPRGNEKKSLSVRI